MGANNALGSSHVGSQPYTLCESIPPAVFVLFLALRLGRTKEDEFTKFSNGLDAAPPLDTFKTRLAARANNKTIDNVRGVLDEPRDGRVSERNLAAESRLKAGLVSADQPPQFLYGSFNSSV